MRTAYIQTVLNIATCCVQRKKNVKIFFSLYMTPFRLAQDNQRFGVNCCLHFQGSRRRVSATEKWSVMQGKERISGSRGILVLCGKSGPTAIVLYQSPRHHVLRENAISHKVFYLYFLSGLFPSFVSSSSPSFSFFHSVSVSVCSV
jgi:hypothetical protein